MATFGLVSAPGAIVEPLITDFDNLHRLDNLYSESLARWRLMMVTLFGLLHGLGFASVLSGLDLPREDFLSSLLLFNIGVEIGQLIVLMMAFLPWGGCGVGLNTLSGWRGLQQFLSPVSAHIG